jgi:hypothetical protein
MTRFSGPRPLTCAEQALLDFLLSVEFSGRAELRAQAESVQAAGACDCGCGTLNLAVHPSAPRSSCREPIPIEAYNATTEVLLFVRDGRLSRMEVVHCRALRQPAPYPRPDDLTLWPWRDRLSPDSGS